MNWLINMFVDWLRKEYLDPLMKTLKAQAAIVYLEGIKGTRRILILFCLMVFITTLIGAGLVLIPLSLVQLIENGSTRAIVGAAIGVVYLLVPLVGAFFVLSEKRWMAVTGARKTVERLLE